MRQLRLFSFLAIVLASVSLLSPNEAVAQSSFCGVCWGEVVCPISEGLRQNQCTSVCGGFDGGGAWCTWSPFCQGDPEGGVLIVCYGNVE